MVNILLVDYACDIQGAKGMATIMALSIFFSEYQLFIKYFVEEPPLFQDFESPNWVTIHQ